ncbi:MAG TPA: histidine phosphatase family protein [Rhizomicrobium sp.]|nr:histidine phosphatase family protein [Rhizomicrobium sp.]
MKIAFLRHGPTEWNAQGRVQGHTDIPLSEEGFQTMQALRPPFPAARVFASPLLRARQTAKAMGFEKPILDARLMEQNWGEWEGLSRAEILARDGDDAFLRAGHAAEFRPPGGESTQKLLARVADFLRDAAREESDAVAIAHLGVLRAAYTLATGWNMATPMPEELDVSKALVLEMDRLGRPALHALNVALVNA